ncbi:MAG: hypothetical protein K0S23_3509 [Fluviicola sp.]|jgi:very-short-patch-repair endonuclease|uniref:hypothetical protein n=1 Tax=Fluviicola sp. TaxID=1917219 RepID=UPI00261CAE1D|nr:hypothetical protein [Fluviicola sp.]MDF3029202.1 hypothetical protein [Fluviicola sp.]
MISTTALAKELNIEPKLLFAQLASNGWIYKKENSWQLTKEGRLAGGDLIYNPKYGEYIAWPKTLKINEPKTQITTINSTKIGEHFSIKSQKINLFFAELGWIEKKSNGWHLTAEGKKQGGFQLEVSNGNRYCVWQNQILNNQFLKRTIEIGLGTYIEKEKKPEDLDDFRQAHPPTKRTADGHYVRSRAEVLIDNFLYTNGIVHAYERRVNIEELMYCDFYLPKEKIFIEFWGLEENTKYEARKKVKLELYAKYGYKLIEIKNSDIDNLDEILATKLRKYGVQVD